VVFLIATKGHLVAAWNYFGFVDGGVSISAHGDHGSVIVAVASVSHRVDEVMGIRKRPIAMNFVYKRRGFVVIQ
jgi:hypothetical protein